MTFSELKKKPIILGIESSCDETAAAVIRGRKLLSSVIISSATEQAKFGGVVPEIASRAHTEAVDEATKQALTRAGIGVGDIDAVAVTYGAGLLGALLVGTAYCGKPYTRTSRGFVFKRRKLTAALCNIACKRRSHRNSSYKDVYRI